MTNYKFYILRSKTDTNDIFYLGITFRDIIIRLREHIRLAKNSMKPEVKERKGLKAQYQRMEVIGFDNIELFVFEEREFNTKKEAMAYETIQIMALLGLGHKLENVVQRRKAVKVQPRRKGKSRYNPNSKYRQPYDPDGYTIDGCWRPYTSIKVKPTETIADIKRRMTAETLKGCRKTVKRLFNY